MSDLSLLVVLNPEVKKSVTPQASRLIQLERLPRDSNIGAPSLSFRTMTKIYHNEWDCRQQAQSDESSSQILR